MTAFPPGWMQKWSNAVLKSGMYGLSARMRSTCAPPQQLWCAPRKAFCLYMEYARQ